MAGLIGLVAVAFVLVVAGPVLATGPGEQLDHATAEVMRVLQDPELRQAARLDERREHIRGIVEGMFDWEELSRQVLSNHWEPLTAGERDEFTALFADVVLRSYLGLIRTYQGQEIDMVRLDETIDGERAAVGTKLISKSTTVPIRYRCIEHDRVWKVYDVAVDGVSVLSSSRSQIGRLIQRFGYGGMMRLLRLKQSQLIAEQSERSMKVGRIEQN